MKLKLIAALAVPVLLVLGGFLAAPSLVRSYVTDHYKGVGVGQVTVHWSKIEFKDVDVERSGIKAHLDRVAADWDRNLVLTGGTVDVDLDQMSGSGMGSSSQVITGEGLALTLHKKGLEAALQATHFDMWNVCFKSGVIQYRDHTATLQDGCIARRTKVVTARHIDVPFRLPFEIPRMEAQQDLRLDDVKVDPEQLKFSFAAASVGTSFKVLHASEVSVSLDAVTLDLDGLEVNHPWISPDTVLFKHVALRAPVSLQHGKGVLRAEIRPVAMTVEPSTFTIEGEASCNDWLEAMPEPLPEALQQAKQHFTGQLGFSVQRDPAPQLKIHNNCRFECSAEPIASVVAAIRANGKPVRYMAYDKDDQLFERQVGPRAKDWVEFSSLPPSIPKAFITMEDPGFQGHRGIIVQALENSLKDNLKLGRFFRGGSTISMQLAKNLWLRRQKTIGRKAQEALLTIALESCLTKVEILELYLNVVEFGPNLYGIGPAAHQYFDKTAESLEPEEAFYLASILPHPRRAIPPKSGGMSNIKGLMRVLADKGFISDELVPVSDGQVNTSDWETE